MPLAGGERRQRGVLEELDVGLLHLPPVLVRGARRRVAAGVRPAEEAFARSAGLVEQFDDVDQPDTLRGTPQAVASAGAARRVDDARAAERPQDLGEIVGRDGGRACEIPAADGLAWRQGGEVNKSTNGVLSGRGDHIVYLSMKK